jgi:hypothetical protein
MDGTNRWLAHSSMSDPGGHAGVVADLPADLGALNAIVQGVMVHSSWVKEYGLDPVVLSTTARKTLPIAERLDDVMVRDSRALDLPRPAGRRSVGTCRDFALMLCSFLRGKSVPARVRCGFAAYFSSGWEDHWVCEYWDADARTWRLSDPQIDEILKQKLGIAFDPTDMPRDAFMTAGEAWLKCRRSDADPGGFGHGSTTGWWFLKVNVMRDHYVLNGRETSSWDRWREAPEAKRVVLDGETELLDDLAARPERPIVQREPDW